MPGRKLAVSLRASLPDDQIGRLRAGFAVLTVLFGITQAGAAFAAPPPERPFAVGSLVALVACCVAGHRLGTFPWWLRVVLVGAVVVLGAAQPDAVDGAAFTATYLIALDDGRRTGWLTAAGMACALVTPAVIGAQAVEPGDLIGQIITLFVLTSVLHKLRTSSRARRHAARAHAPGALRRAHRPAEPPPLPPALLDRAVARYRSAGVPYALFVMDLDGFKRVNDTYDHDQGDRLLAEVGRRVAATVRKGDHCARLGGDVTWSGEDADAALRDADRAMHAVKLAAGARR